MYIIIYIHMYYHIYTFHYMQSILIPLGKSQSALSLFVYIHIIIYLLLHIYNFYYNVSFQWVRHFYKHFYYDPAIQPSTKISSHIIPWCGLYASRPSKIEGILTKGPYLPCVSMAGRALLAGYHRNRAALDRRHFIMHFEWKWFYIDDKISFLCTMKFP